MSSVQSIISGNAQLVKAHSPKNQFAKSKISGSHFLETSICQITNSLNCPNSHVVMFNGNIYPLKSQCDNNNIISSILQFLTRYLPANSDILLNGFVVEFNFKL